MPHATTTSVTTTSTTTSNTTIAWECTSAGYIGYTAYNKAGDKIYEMQERVVSTGFAETVPIPGSVHRINVVSTNSNGFYGIIKVIQDDMDQVFRCINCATSRNHSLGLIYLDGTEISKMNDIDHVPDHAHCKAFCTFVAGNLYLGLCNLEN